MNLVRVHADRHSGWPESLQALLGTVIVAVFVVTFIVQAFQIPSESMENTLLTGDYLLVDKLHFGADHFWGHFLPYRKVKRGDIVVFYYPVHPSEHFVKRVIGVPGDRIRLVNRRVYVNGVLQIEPYAQYSRPNDGGPDAMFRDDFPQSAVQVGGVTAPWRLQMAKLVDNGELIVPEGNYFVMGDNRDDSLDSRYWGFVPHENIVGRPLVIYWSMRDQEPADPSNSDKLTRFVYAMSHLVQITRWDRAMRLVR
ncbi:MAG TPA: signal peptidase I [Terriglobales bacterium]|nr:signal peptidase I [Terriglobales bacterium]